MDELYRNAPRSEYVGLSEGTAVTTVPAPAVPMYEVREALNAGKGLAHQIAALTDTLCGAMPESTGGPSCPKPGAIIPDLAHDAGETLKAIAKASLDINRLMRAFGI
ncbi:hypothetical protein [Agrobacterium tumefaciens]|uniref:hypothetical protein n=1 Tax=Agrobacterium tumefaciens TaxID=358 RepID=UPI0015725A51|nr:hypothetical protein [Agrobacterium tumefaciens]NTB01083.1 hypothetical protein [Agrobacterium tumefaciens]